MADTNRLIKADDIKNDFYQRVMNRELIHVGDKVGFVWINMKDKDMEPGMIDALRKAGYECSNSPFGWEIRKML